jgi:nucleotide-binding universal stress UspA family protein
MDKIILLGVDASFTSTTQQTIRVVGDLVDHAPNSFRVILLHVIPITQVTTEHTGPFVEQYFLSLPTHEQINEAEEALKKMSLELQEYGLSRAHIEQIVRIGIPAEEICKVAQERQISLIVVGSRGNGWKQNLRRFIMGSTSRRVLKMAPCPVMIVLPTKTQQVTNLVSSYEEAIKKYLEQQPQQLMVFTPEATARCFSPETQKEVGPREIQAAATALEHLAERGHLFRREVQGNVQYIND